MEAPRAEDVIAFLTARGFAAAAAALRDDLISRRPTGKAVPYLDLDLDVGSELPPLRLLPPSRSSGGGGENAPPSAASSSSDAFASLYSSPSELMNPYGVWSPARPRSDDELTNQHSEFGTAREYNNYWYDDQYGDEPFLARNASGQLTMSNSTWDMASSLFIFNVDNDLCFCSSHPHWGLPLNADHDPVNADHDPIHNKDLSGDSSNGKIIFVNKMEDEKLEKGVSKKSYSIPPFEEGVSKNGVNCAYEYGNCRTVDGEAQDSESVGLQVEDDITDEVHLYNSPEDELEVFDFFGQ